MGPGTLRTRWRAWWEALFYGENYPVPAGRMNLAEYVHCARLMRARRLYGPVTSAVLQEARLDRLASGRRPADPTWKPRYRVRAA